MQEGHPLQEGPSSQEGSLAWFLEYFGKLNATMERMDQCQEQQEKYFEQIEQCQEKKEKYNERLGDLYENLYEQQIDFNKQSNDGIAEIETQLGYLWFTTHPIPPLANFPPPPPPPPPPPFYLPSSSYRHPLPPPY